MSSKEALTWVLIFSSVLVYIWSLKSDLTYERKARNEEMRRHIHDEQVLRTINGTLLEELQHDR
jgi:hypothetical protein